MFTILIEKYIKKSFQKLKKTNGPKKISPHLTLREIHKIHFKTK